MGEAGTGSWEPIDIVTPAKWRTFCGVRIGSSSVGFAAAFCPTVMLFGIEIIAGESRGLAVCIGPLTFAVAILTPTGASHD